MTWADKEACPRWGCTGLIAFCWVPSTDGNLHISVHPSSCCSSSPPAEVNLFWMNYLSVSSVTQSCPTLCDSMDCSTPGFRVLHCLPEPAQTHVHWANDVIISCPLLLLPSIFPSIEVFSNESVVHIRWPKYWSFSFSISPSNEYSGLTSFRIDWLDLLAVQGTLKSSTPQFKSINSSVLIFLYSPTLTPIHDT